METKELFKDKYVKSQDAATVVYRYYPSHEYVGTIGQLANYGTAEIPVEQPQQLLRRYDDPASLVTIRRAEPAAEDQLVTYLTGSTGVANSQRVVEEQQVRGYVVLRPSGTDLTSGSLLEEFAGLLEHLTQELVEVYPGFTVTREDYQCRFGGVELDYYQQRMKPDVFRSFVKSMGTVRGVDGLSDRSLGEYEG